MLGAAGTMLQRLTGNPLASPEVLGVGAGAGVGLTIVFALDPQPTWAFNSRGQSRGP